MPGVVECKSWRPHVEPNSRRMYPNDPVRELRRLTRRAARMADGFGTFNHLDVNMMEAVEAEIRGKLKRLAFLDEKVREMVKGEDDG